MERDNLIGRVIAGHRIEALLGEGGMGVVYRARHERLGKVRALKLLPPQFARDEDFRERFEREWRLAASIDHPNIVEVLDAGESDERLYILMRLIDGPDLGTVVKREGALAPERAVGILEQIADALDAAHDQGLIHRDVTPRNVLVAAGDRAYLADFGVARTTKTRGLTRTGYFVGNLDYAAPEQIDAKEIDERVDVYGLGGVLYTCLTGGRPYERDSEVQLMFAHLNDPPPAASAVRPELPPSIDAVIERAMAKEPAARFDRCSELVAAAHVALHPPLHETVKVGVAATVVGKTAGATKNGGSTRSGEHPAITGPASGGNGTETIPLRVFINYRRGDSSGYAGRLYDALSGYSPDWRVFMDIDTIEPGADFVEVIDKALTGCDVVIAMIGKQWIGATDARGQRRLDDPNDFVRLELATALERKVRVIPALVQGIEMPGADEFPDVLAPLARRHALELSDGRWRYDVERLAQQLERIQQQATDERRAAEEAKREAHERRIKREAAKRAAVEREARDVAEHEAAAQEAEEAKRAAAAKASEAAELEAREAAEREAAAQEAQEAERAAAARKAREAEIAAAAAGARVAAGPKMREAATPEARDATRREAREAAQQRRAADSSTKQDRARRQAATVTARDGKEGAVRARPGRRKAILLVTLGGLLLAGGATAAAVFALGSSSSSSSSTPTPAPLPPSKPDIRLAGFRTNLPAPVPGEPFDAQATAFLRKTGRPLSDPKVSCRARAGSKALRGAHLQRGRQFHCRWNIPFSAAGSVLTGSITVAYKGVSKKHAFWGRVAPVPASLTISRTTSPTAVAGNDVQTTFRVQWLRKDGKRRAINRTSTRALCHPVISGTPVTPAPSQISAAGVTCRLLVPTDAGGKKLTIAVTVTSKGSTAHSSVTGLIEAPAPRPAPTPTYHPSPTPSPPPTVTSPIPGP